MFTVTVEARFPAVHRLRLGDGTFEPRHGHDWLVRASFARAKLDESGMIIDFGRAREALHSIVADLHDADLNSHDGLAGENPTAEIMARYIFERLAKGGLTIVSSVEVTEAQGCTARYGLSEPFANAE